MDAKRKTKAAHIMTGILTFGIIFTASSVGSLPAANCEAYHARESEMNRLKIMTMGRKKKCIWKSMQRAV